ncbi:MAG TPA: response regulator [Anaerolineae bacterium]|nr:response regulator [Anaerolineae bacterium]
MEEVHTTQSAGNILVVDDAALSLRALTKLLTENHYTVRGAADGMTALTLAAAEPPDLILLDVRLPDIDGYEVCRRLKEAAETQHIPVVFLSAMDDIQDKVQGFAVGGVDYITKPFQVEEVLIRAKTHLTIFNLQRQLERQNTTLQEVNLALTSEIEERQCAEIALQKLNVELERRVAERTTALVQANAELRRVNRASRTIGDCNQALVRAADEETLLQQICHIIAEHGYYCLVWVGFPDPGEAPSVYPVAMAGSDTTWLQRRQMGHTVADGAADPTYVALNTGQTVLIPDVQLDFRFTAWRSEMLQYDCHSFVALPLLFEQQVLGVLNIHAVDPGAFTAEEIHLFASLADDLAYGIVTLRTRTEQRQATMEREHLIAQIQEQAQRVQQIISTVPEGVFLLDMEGQIVLANPLGKRDLQALAGVTVGDLLTHLGGRSLDELFTSPPAGLWHELMVGGRYFQTIARSIETGPTSGGWVFVVRDMTQQHDIDRRVRQQERLAAVGQLAAGIAHDFNNIMATIMLYTQLTARVESLSERDRERLATVNQQARHASRLIQQILDFSRGVELERAHLDLVPLLKEHVQLLKRTLPENIRVEIDGNLTEEYAVSGDPTRLQQVFMNLAVNARDAMPDGGTLRFELARVRVDTPRESPLPEMLGDSKIVGDWIKITISDTGEGIPPEIMTHLYEPFYTTKAPGKGTGLGLAQVHGIVTAHEGHIDVSTQAGQGTTFVLYLPALVAPTVAVSQDSAHLAVGHGRLILLVEDNAVTRNALRESLELLDYRVLTANNGEEALALFAQHRDEIALVLSDMIMPEMGGRALLHTLRAQGETVKMVILTGHPLQEELETLRADGLNDWLLKPPSLERLSEVVAQVLRA